MIVMTVLLGMIYPPVITGISQVVFPGNAYGQRVKVDGRLDGSKIIGQQFADQVVKNGKPEVDKNGNPVTTRDPKHFQTRPSATVPPDNAAATPSATSVRTMSRPSRRSLRTSARIWRVRSRMTRA